MWRVWLCRWGSLATWRVGTGRPAREYYYVFLSWWHPRKSVQTFPDLRNFRLVQFFERGKNLKWNISDTSTGYFMAEMKARWGEGGGRRLLVDNTAVGQSCHGQSGCTVLEFWFRVDSLVCARIVDHMYTQFWLVRNASWCCIFHNATTAWVS